MRKYLLLSFIFLLQLISGCFNTHVFLNKIGLSSLAIYIYKPIMILFAPGSLLAFKDSTLYIQLSGLLPMILGNAASLIFIHLPIIYLAPLLFKKSENNGQSSIIFKVYFAIALLAIVIGGLI